MATIPCLLVALALFLGIGASARAQVLQSGTRFLVAFPDTVRNLPERIAGGSAEPAFTELAWLVVYADRPTRVSVRGEGYAIDVPVDPARATIVRIPADARRFSVVNMTPMRDAYEVTAEHPISLYCYFATAFGAEAFTPIPVELWGTEYTVPGVPSETVLDDLTFIWNEEGTYREVYAPAQFIVVAAEDETVVTIDATANLGAWESVRRKVTVTLDAGETWLAQPGAPPPPDPRPGQPRLAFGVSDLARTSVTSTKPIGILAANTRTQGSRWTPGFVWTGNSIKNVAAEWLAPRVMNGTRYAYASPWGIDGASQQDLVRLYGTGKTRGGVRGSFGQRLPQLGFGEMHQYSLGDVFGNDGSFWLHTNERAQVTVNGTTGVLMNNVIATGGIQTWSAASVDLVPRERWGDYTRFHLPGYPVALQHAVALVADPDAEVLIDGEPIEGWKYFFDAPYKWVRLALDSGDYTISSTRGRFTGVAAGRMSGYEAYRPLKARGESSPGLMHAAVYHERISIAYAYPLLTGFIEPDSVSIATSSDCTGMRVGVTLEHAAGGTASDRIIIADSINTRVVVTERRAGTSVVGWDIRMSPRDTTVEASATLRVYSPFGTSTVLPYRYVPARPEARPAQLDLYDSYIDVARSFTIDLLNRGDSALVLRSARLADGTRGYAIVSAPPGTIAPGGALAIALSFTGTSYATYYRDTLVLEGPCWSVRVPIVSRTRAFLPEPLPEITPVDWSDRWLSTLDACTKSGIDGYDSVIAIANRGTRAFVVVSLALVGADAPFFELDSSDAARSVGFGDVVYPDSVALQPVRFLPDDERQYQCTIELVTQDRDTVRATLRGRGIESHVALEPDPLDIGATLFRAPGDTVSTGDAIVRALPTRPLTVTGLAIDGVAPGEIAIDGRGGFIAPDPADRSTWWRLAPGEQRRVPLLFAPLDTGVVRGRLLVSGDHATCDDSTIAVLGRTWRALATVAPPVVITSLNCEDARGEATVVNSGPVPLVVVDARVEPVGAPFAVDRSMLPRVLEPGGRLTLPIAFTPSDSGVATALLRIDVRDTTGEFDIGVEPAALTGYASARPMRLSIGRDYRMLPGERTTLEVRLDAPPSGGALRRLGIDMAIDPLLFRVVAVGEGDLTDEWTIDVLEQSAERLRVELTAPAGASLDRPGVVLAVLVEGYLSRKMAGDVPFVAMAIDERCMGAVATPGHIAIDTICGLSTRWLESFGVTWKLDAVRVAADGTSAAIDVALALDGPATIDIIDAGGRIVARLADATQRAGAHTLVWDASSAAPGVYVARAAAGEWSESRRFVVVR